MSPDLYCFVGLFFFGPHYFLIGYPCSRPTLPISGYLCSSAGNWQIITQSHVFIIYSVKLANINSLLLCVPLSSRQPSRLMRLAALPEAASSCLKGTGLPAIIWNPMTVKHRVFIQSNLSEQGNAFTNWHLLNDNLLSYLGPCSLCESWIEQEMDRWTEAA